LQPDRRTDDQFGIAQSDARLARQHAVSTLRRSSVDRQTADITGELYPRRTGIHSRPRLVHGTFTFFEGLDDGGRDRRSRELSRRFVFGLQPNQLGITPSCLADCPRRSRSAARIRAASSAA
jgi:hypothetical protein